jgi:hypothetical protein
MNPLPVPPFAAGPDFVIPAANQWANVYHNPEICSTRRVDYYNNVMRENGKAVLLKNLKKCIRARVRGSGVSLDTRMTRLRTLLTNAVLRNGDPGEPNVDPRKMIAPIAGVNQAAAPVVTLIQIPFPLIDYGNVIRDIIHIGQIYFLKRLYLIIKLYVDSSKHITNYRLVDLMRTGDSSVPIDLPMFGNDQLARILAEINRERPQNLCTNLWTLHHYINNIFNYDEAIALQEMTESGEGRHKRQDWRTTAKTIWDPYRSPLRSDSVLQAFMGGEREPPFDQQRLHCQGDYYDTDKVIGKYIGPLFEDDGDDGHNHLMLEKPRFVDLTTNYIKYMSLRFGLFEDNVWDFMKRNQCKATARGVMDRFPHDDMLASPCLTIPIRNGPREVGRPGYVAAPAANDYQTGSTLNYTVPNFHQGIIDQQVVIP